MARTIRVALLVGLSLAGKSAAAQSPGLIRVEARHFGLTLPEGWTVMGPEDLGRVNQVWRTSQGVSGGPDKYVLGLTPVSQPPEGRVLVLVEWEPSQNASMSRGQMESLLRTNLSAVQQDLGTSSGAELSEPTFDWANGRMYFMTSLPSPTGPVEAISYGKLALDGIAWMHCYSPAPRIGELGPVFARIANGLIIDEGYAFNPAPDGGVGGPAPGGSAGGSISTTQLVLIAGVVVLIVGGLVIRARAARGPGV